MSLLGGSTHFEGISKNNRFSFLTGIRRKTTQYILNSLDTEADYKPTFTDIQTLLKYEIKSDWSISFLGNISNNTYQMIPENRNTELPSFIKESMGDWVAGCDICQEVCPWNQQQLPESSDPDVIPKEWVLKLTKKEALSWDDNQWNHKLRESALKRIKPWMWRRNLKGFVGSK